MFQPKDTDWLNGYKNKTSVLPQRERERVENEIGNFSGVRSCRVLYAILWDLGAILSMIKSHWRKRVSSTFENDYSSFCMDDKP